jgi:cytochrome c biogenesis factor
MSFIISVLKTRDLVSLRQKLILLYILNVTDIIFTIFLVSTGSFQEVSAFMAPLVNNMPLASIIIKIAVPSVLLLGIYQRMKKAAEKQLFQSNIIITGCLIFYVLINISHVLCSILYAIVKV